MASMSYCRFENTVVDLLACLNDLYEYSDKDCTLSQFLESRTSYHESAAVGDLYKLCAEFVETYENMGKI